MRIFAKKALLFIQNASQCSMRHLTMAKKHGKYFLWKIFFDAKKSKPFYILKNDNQINVIKYSPKIFNSRKNKSFADRNRKIQWKFLSVRQHTQSNHLLLMKFFWKTIEKIGPQFKECYQIRLTFVVLLLRAEKAFPTEFYKTDKFWVGRFVSAFHR